MKAMDSQKSFNHKYRVEQFHKWQEYMFNEAYVIPTINSYCIVAVSDKITGYSLRPSKNINSHQLCCQVGYAK